MTHSPESFKSFEPRPGHTACRLPTLVDQLVGHLMLPGYFELDELREMSKFKEWTNLHGVAAYAIERPATEDFDPAATLHEGGPAALAPIPELPAGVARPLGNRLEAEQLLLVQGALRLGGEEAFLVQAIVPRPYAHLAAALKIMLHPWPSEEEEGLLAADFTLLVWPEPLLSRHGKRLAESFVGYWPAPSGRAAQGVGLVIGHDDPALLAGLIDDAARRKTGSGSGSETDAASVDPWATPLVPAAVLAATAEGRVAALSPGAWLFGVTCDRDGHFPLLEPGVPEAEALTQRELAGGGWVLVGGEERTEKT